jgi:hypothetical protein
MTTPDPFEKVTFRGRLMDRKTQAFLEAMESRLGYELTVVQGCYSNPATKVSASAGTHDGGGVVDLAAWDWERKVKVAADLGGFPYHRDDLPGVWGEHIHVGIRDHGRLAPAAQRQQQDWDARPPRDGLAGHRILTGQYHPGREITFTYPPKEQPTVPKPTHVSQARDALVESIHDLGTAISHLQDADASRKVAKDLVDDLQIHRRAQRELLAELPKR